MEAPKKLNRSRSRSPSQRRPPTHYMHRTDRKDDADHEDDGVKSLQHENYAAFLAYYFSNHAELSTSAESEGKKFTDFIETCRRYIMTSRVYKEYNPVSKTCYPIANGPTQKYTGLLRHIIHHAESYTVEQARKIHQLLFWFEQQGITHLIVIPRDEPAVRVFNTYTVPPRYREVPDGKLEYCSPSGNVYRNGMEISNSRVNELLTNIHWPHEKEQTESDGGSRRHRRRDRRSSTATRNSKRGSIKSTRTRRRHRRRDDSRRRT